jgi:hypothetical protein
MARLESTGQQGFRELRDKFQARLERCNTLEESAQAWADLFYREFEESIVLARVYATIRFAQLPLDTQDFVRKLARAKGVASDLVNDTFVLTLLGTRGSRPEWNDRKKSQGHAGIPLVHASFVESIPMIARMMAEMGAGIDWIDKHDTKVVVNTIGKLAGVFYVRDAKSAVDPKGRLIIPAQDFVATHNVKTVFGMGGAYLNGSFVVLVAFSRETIDKGRVEPLITLVNFFKTATMNAVAGGKLFASG